MIVNPRCFFTLSAARRRQSPLAPSGPPRGRRVLCGQFLPRRDSMAARLSVAPSAPVAAASPSRIICVGDAADGVAGSCATTACFGSWANATVSSTAPPMSTFKSSFISRIQWIREFVTFQCLAAGIRSMLSSVGTCLYLSDNAVDILRERRPKERDGRCFPLSDGTEFPSGLNPTRRS